MVMGYVELFTYRSLDQVQPVWMLPQSFSTPLLLCGSKGYKLKDLFLVSSKLVTSAGKSYCPSDPGRRRGQRYGICLLWWVAETCWWAQQWNLLCCCNCSVFLLDLWKMLVQPPQLSSNRAKGRRNKNRSGACLDPSWQAQKCKNNRSL